MEKRISADDASRSLPEMLRGLRKGWSYVITLRGRAVARLVPARMDERPTEMARAVLLKRLKSQPAATKPGARRRWTRDELHY
jgi:prevent-host-death family protein